MTTTPLDYFDSTPGILEQLVLAVIAQKLANTEYSDGLLDTGFVGGSVDYSITADTRTTGAFDAFLNIELSFPTIPFERQILTDADDFSKRIMSINAAHIADLYLPRKATYPQGSLTAVLPAYLSTNNPNNILERRIFTLCYQLRNTLNWIQRWNSLNSAFLHTIYFVDSTNQLPLLAYYDNEKMKLDSELLNGFNYSDKTYLIPPNGNFTSIGLGGEAGTFGELAASFGTSDPYNDNDFASNLSEGLLNQLNNSPTTDPITASIPESPTLPDC